VVCAQTCWRGGGSESESSTDPNMGLTARLTSEVVRDLPQSDEAESVGLEMYSSVSTSDFGLSFDGPPTSSSEAAVALVTIKTGGEGALDS
jgi:hypothetical protein